MSYLFPSLKAGYPLLKPAVISQLEGGDELGVSLQLAVGNGSGPQGLWNGKGGIYKHATFIGRQCKVKCLFFFVCVYALGVDLRALEINFDDL
jgi:hypothetical protein